MAAMSALPLNPLEQIGLRALMQERQRTEQALQQASAALVQIDEQIKDGLGDRLPEGADVSDLQPEGDTAVAYKPRFTQESR